MVRDNVTDEAAGMEDSYSFDAGYDGGIDSGYEADSQEEISIDEVFVVDPMKELKQELLPEGDAAQGAAEGEEGDPTDTGDLRFNFEKPRPDGPPIPGIPPKKDFNFKEPHSKPTRNQMVHYKRLCKKLGIPADIAEQTAALFYNSKELINLRMRELELMAFFEEMMALRPGSTTDILRLLSLKTEIMRIRAHENLGKFHDAVSSLPSFKGADGKGSIQPTVAVPGNGGKTYRLFSLSRSIICHAMKPLLALKGKAGGMFRAKTEKNPLPEGEQRTKP